MTFTKEVVISKKEFDRKAISILVNEEIDKLLQNPKYNVFPYVETETTQLVPNLEATVIIGLKFMVNHDQDLEYNFASSFKLTDKMDEVHVRNAAREVITGLEDSFKKCIKADLESLAEYVNSL